MDGQSFRTEKADGGIDLLFAWDGGGGGEEGQVSEAVVSDSCCEWDEGGWVDAEYGEGEEGEEG